MHVILVSLGTDGDILPYVGLGARLVARGHRVTLLANEKYEHRAGNEGFAFHPLVSEVALRSLLANPLFWHPFKAAKVTAEWGAGMIRRHFDLLAGLAADGDSILVANPAVIAARLVHEVTGRPLVSVVLQPWMIKSLRAPPIMPGGIPTWTPRIAYRLVYRLINRAGGKLIGPELNTLRRELKLPPLRQRFFEWWWSQDLILGLFPAWYAPPQSDWLPQIRLTGFPLTGGDAEGEGLPPDLFAYCHEADAPIVFSFGTGMMHAGSLLEAAIDACRMLKRRGIFLTRHTAQLPRTLPPYVRHWNYAPFAHLFPHCAAVVHHGGIGTTARALAAGTPQLIIPFAFDQPDNANRVRRFGAGAWLPKRKANAYGLTRALHPLLTTPMRDRCGGLASKLGVACGLDEAANHIEEQFAFLQAGAEDARPVYTKSR